MAVMVYRELELGADAVRRRHQQWVLVSGGARIEECAEAAEVGVRAGTGRGPGERGDRLHQRVSGGDRHPGLCLGVAALRCVFAVGHDRAIAASADDFHTRDRPDPTFSENRRTEENTSELPSQMRIPYAVF